MGQESDVSCVLMLEEAPSSTEIMQIDEVVAAGYNGPLYLVMQKHGLIFYRWYADGNTGQCSGAPSLMCADVGSFTQEYRDDTDSRPGGCCP